MATRNRLIKKELFVLAGTVITLFLFSKTYYKILNYPELLYLESESILFVAILLYKIRRFTKRIAPLDRIDKMGAILLHCVKSAIFSCFLTGILLIPLNYFIIYTARDTASFTIYAEIKKLVTRGRAYQVFYEFNGSERELYDNEKIPTDVATHGNHKSYHIEFTVRKSILGTLVIEDWNIVQKI